MIEFDIGERINNKGEMEEKGECEARVATYYFDLSFRLRFRKRFYSAAALTMSLYW